VRCVETKESFPSGEIVWAMVIDKNGPRETSSVQLLETPNSSLLNSYILFGVRKQIPIPVIFVNEFLSVIPPPKELVIFRPTTQPPYRITIGAAARNLNYRGSRTIP